MTERIITAEELEELVRLIDTVLERMPPARREALAKELNAIAGAEDVSREVDSGRTEREHAAPVG